MDQSQIKALAATGDVTTRDTNLRTVVLAGGSAASTLVVKAGGSGGTTVLTLAAPIGDSVVAELHDAYCDGGVHATLSGTGAAASFVYVTT